MKHSVADTHQHDKLASATKKYMLLGSFEQDYLLRMTCFACFPFKSIAGKPKLSFSTLLPLSSAEQVGFRAANTSIGWIALLKTVKEKLCIARAH